LPPAAARVAHTVVASHAHAGPPALAEPAEDPPADEPAAPVTAPSAVAAPPVRDAYASDPTFVNSPPAPRPAPAPPSPGAAPPSPAAPSQEAASLSSGPSPTVAAQELHRVQVVSPAVVDSSSVTTTGLLHASLPSRFLPPPTLGAAFAAPSMPDTTSTNRSESPPWPPPGRQASAAAPLSAGAFGTLTAPSSAAALPFGMLLLAAAWAALHAANRQRPAGVSLPELAPPG
jgi:hypothetical protein